MPRFLHPDKTSNGSRSPSKDADDDTPKRSLSRLFRKRSPFLRPSLSPSPVRHKTTDNSNLDSSKTPADAVQKERPLVVEPVNDTSAAKSTTNAPAASGLVVTAPASLPQDDARTASLPAEGQPTSTNVWRLACDDFKAEDLKLFTKFTELIELGSDTGKPIEKDNIPKKDDFEWNEPPADKGIARIEALKAHRAELHAKSARFRHLFEETVKLVISAKPAIAAATASNPYASTAWTAISLILPIFIVSSEENVAAIEGLKFASILIVEYRWKEKCYLSPDSTDDFVDELRKLYKGILQYEAALYDHLNQVAMRRFRKNLLKKGQWTARLESLKALDASCKKITGAITELRSQEWRNQERKWQQDMLNQPRHQEEKVNLQKLYSRYEAAKNLNPMHVPGTLVWFLQHPTFLSWRVSQSSALLWLTHDPECGKSVLCKYLIDRQAEPIRAGDDPTVCYYFFTREDIKSGNVAVAIRSLLHQLFAQRPYLYKYAALDFEEKGDRFLEDFDTLWQIFVAAIKDKELEESICVLDGLDCCENTDELRRLIGGLVDLAKQFDTGDRGLVKILVTSRPYMELESEFRDLTDAMPDARLPGEKDSNGIKRDINLVQEAMVQKLAKKRRLPPQAKQALSQHLSKVSNRTYLWLTLTFKFLEGQVEIDKRTIPKLLQQLPNSVDDAFTRILEGVKDPDRARQLLQYVLGAAAPLSTMEINILMHMEQDCRSTSELQLWPPHEIESTVRNICNLFMSVVDDRVYLIHPKARDYLEPPKESTRTKQALAASDWRHTFHQSQSAHALTQACVSFLALEDLQNENLGIDSWRMKYTRGLELFPYAATHWPFHFTQAKSIIPERLRKQVVNDLYGSNRHVFDLWVKQYQAHCSPNYLPLNATRLMWAAFLGQEAVVAEILELDPEIDALDSHGRSALFFASYAGSEETVRLLMGHHAMSNIKDILRQTPLHVSIQKKHLQVSKILASTSPDITTRDVFGFTPLQYGSDEFVEEIAIETKDKVKANFPPAAATTADTAQSISSQALERLKEKVQHFIAEQNNSGKWKSTSENQLLSDPTSARSFGLGAGYDALREAINTFEESEVMYEEGRRLTVTAFNMVDLMVRSESPRLLLYIPRNMAFLWSRKYHDLTEAFIGHFASKMCAHRGASHPLAVLFSDLHHILRLPDPELAPVIDGLITCIIDEWSRLLSPHHYQVTYSWHVYWLIKGWLDGPQSISSQLITVSQNMDAVPGRNSIQAIQLRADVAQNQLDCAAYQDAQEMGKDASDRVLETLSDRLKRDPRMVHLLCEGLRIAGEAATKLNEMDEAEAHLRKALETAEELLGPRHVRSRELRRRLGKWMRERGRLEEALELDTWR